MFIVSLLLLSITASTPDPLSSAVQSFQSVDTYRVTLRSKSEESSETIRYHYKRPGFVSMEFIKPRKGSVLVYDPLAMKASVRPFGFIRPLILTLDPNNALIRSSKGHTVDRSDIGELLRKAALLREKGDAAFMREEKVNGRSALLIIIEGIEGYHIDGIHRYMLWLEKDSSLPLRAAAYDLKGKLIEEVLMDDLEVNIPLSDGIFRLE